MHSFRRQLPLALLLIVLSVVCYTFHYFVFHDLHHMLMFLVEDVAFVFLEVLLVTLVIHSLLERRERQARLQKMNVVVGVFFSEVGTRLLAMLVEASSGHQQIAAALQVTPRWQAKDYAAAGRQLTSVPYKAQVEGTGAKAMQTFLLAHRPFLLRLLENPILLEHEAFTEMLQAVFHLSEELAARDDFATAPDADRTHLAGDAKRVYLALSQEWLAYLRHLQVAYPYLFSLAARTNPFAPEATAVVTAT